MIPEQDLKALLMQAYWESSGSNSYHGSETHLIHVEDSKYLFGGSFRDDPWYNVPIDLEKLSEGIEKLIAKQVPPKLEAKLDYNKLPMVFRNIPFTSFMALFEALDLSLTVTPKS